jgi:hypothetical protein
LLPFAGWSARPRTYVRVVAGVTGGRDLQKSVLFEGEVVGNGTH